MKCIICGKEEASSDEHIFSESLGGKKKISFVCAKCNSSLGNTIEADFLNDSSIVLLRGKFGIRNKRKQKIDLIKRLDFHEKKSGEKIIKVNNKWTTISRIKNQNKDPLRIITAPIEYNGLVYLNYCVKVVHEFLFKLWGDRYRSTELFSLLSDYLFDRIRKKQIDKTKYEEIEKMKIALTSIDDSKKRLAFEIVVAEENYISISVNIFNYICFRYIFKDDSKSYSFLENYVYDDCF